MLLDYDNTQQEEILLNEQNMALSNCEALLMMQRAIQTRKELMEKKKIQVEQNQ